MTVLLALLFLGVLDNKVPTDSEIAARIEAAIRLQMAPRTVQVTVHRASRFTTTLDSLDITLSGFTAEKLPFGTTAPAPTAVPASVPARAAAPAYAGLDAPGALPTAPTRAAKPEKMVRIVKLRLLCEDFTVQGLPVQSLEMTLDEVRIPFAAVNAGNFAIAAADAATGAVTLHERGLAQYLLGRELPVKEPKVRITSAGLQVTGGLKAFLNAPVELRGKLAVRNGAVLYLDRPAIHMLKVPVPGFLTQRALKEIDPLTDLNKDMNLPVPLVISAVTHQQGTLRFDATLQLPKANIRP
jgi:hypothetical protein